MIIAGVAAVLTSLVALAILGARDPKRLRSLAHDGESNADPPARLWRAVCVAIVLAPGLWLAMSAQWWMFLVWLGSTIGAGWALAHLFAARPPA